MGLLDWMPSRRRLAREKAEAQREADDTDRHEAEAETSIRDAYLVAHKLAEHRRHNHFSQRMRAAYRGQGGRA